jgi:hypothetical protein
MKKEQLERPAYGRHTSTEHYIAFKTLAELEAWHFLQSTTASVEVDLQVKWPERFIVPTQQHVGTAHGSQRELPVAGIACPLSPRRTSALTVS